MDRGTQAGQAMQHPPVQTSSSSREAYHDAAPGGLRLNLLGPFQCWRDGQLLPPEVWRTRQTLHLFKLLLEARGRVVQAEQLMEALWPGRSASAASRSLRVAIRTLRLALEPALERGSDSRYVRTGHGGYRFDANGCVLDVDAFNAAQIRAVAAGQRSDREALLVACHEALALYRGDYLADDPYEEWTFAARERFKLAYVDLIQQACSVLNERREWEAAIALSERGLSADPFREELYRILMECHFALGRRAHALSVYERCRQLLQAELGIQPASETTRLRSAIAADTGTAPGSSAEERDRSIPPTFSLPFAGREREMRQLDRAWLRSQREQRLVVAIEGVPGIGKTRLIEEWIASTQSAAAEPETAPAPQRIVNLTCYEAEQALAYVPVTRVLSGWLEQARTLGERRKLRVLAPVLSQLLPQASMLDPESATTADGARQIEAGQLLEALIQAVRVMLGDGPCVLVVDDAQWADASTLIWLGHVARRAESGLLIVVGLRSGEPVPRALEQFMASARRLRGLVELELEPLEPSAVEQAMSHLANGADQRRRRMQDLYAVTRGHPMMLVETVRDLGERGYIAFEPAVGWQFTGDAMVADWSLLPAPQVVRDMVIARIQRLDEVCREVFTAICVMAVETSAASIAAVTGRPIDVVLDALDRLLERRLLRISDGGQAYAVEHPLAQQALTESLSAERLRMWHLRIAEGLAAGADDGFDIPPRQVLRHLGLGGAADERVLRFALLAGDAAARQSAFSEAVENYQLAAGISARARRPGARPAARFDVSERLADSLAAAGRWPEAIELFDELIEGAELVLDRNRTRRKLAVLLGDVAGRFDEALELLAVAEVELRARNGDEPALVELGRVAAARSSVHFYRSEYRAVIEFGRQALAAWDDSPQAARDTIDVLLRLGQAEQRLGHLEHAERRFRQALARARNLGDRALEARCGDNYGGFMFQRGRLADGLARHEATLQAGIELGIPRLEISGAVNRANALVMLGRLEEGREVYEQAIERAESLDARYSVMHALVGLGEALVRLGELDAARRVLRRGMRLAEEIGNVQRRGHACLYMAELELYRGDAELAREWAERGIGMGASINDNHAAREGHAVLARALNALGAFEEAERAALRGLNAARRGGFLPAVARNLLALGETLAALGRFEESALAFDEAEDIARTAGALELLAWLLLTRVRCHTEAADAMHLLAEASALATQAGARPLLARMAETSPETSS